MKKILLLILVLIPLFVNGQIFKPKQDTTIASKSYVRTYVATHSSVVDTTNDIATKYDLIPRRNIYYTDSIDLSRVESYYKTDTITADSTYRIKKIGQIVGGSAVITIKGDGTHNIRVLNATVDPNSSDFDIVAGHRNRLTIFKDDEDIWYSITNLD